MGLLFTVVTGALTIYLLASFDTAEPGFQFVSQHEWIGSWGISWFVGVDGISLFLLVLTGVLFPIALLGADAHHDEKPYTAWMLLLEAGLLGSFLALDLFLFFVFFEIVLVPMYFLIGGWGYDNRACGPQVLPVHHGRVGIHARRRRRDCVLVRGRDRHTHVQPR